MKGKQIDLLWDIKSLAYELYGESYGDSKCQTFAQRVAQEVNDFLTSMELDPTAHTRGEVDAPQPNK